MILNRLQIEEEDRNSQASTETVHIIYEYDKPLYNCDTVETLKSERQAFTALKKLVEKNPDGRYELARVELDTEGEIVSEDELTVSPAYEAAERQKEEQEPTKAETPTVIWKKEDTDDDEQMQILHDPTIGYYYMKCTGNMVYIPLPNNPTPEQLADYQKQGKIPEWKQVVIKDEPFSLIECAEYFDLKLAEVLKLVKSKHTVKDCKITFTVRCEDTGFEEEFNATLSWESAKEKAERLFWLSLSEDTEEAEYIVTLIANDIEEEFEVSNASDE